MIDRVEEYHPGGGPRMGLGYIRGTKDRSIPTEWFFEAHFYPGSGLPGFLWVWNPSNNCLK